MNDDKSISESVEKQKTQYLSILERKLTDFVEKADCSDVAGDVLPTEGIFIVVFALVIVVVAMVISSKRKGLPVRGGSAVSTDWT
jgi:hypothetical protein